MTSSFGETTSKANGCERGFSIDDGIELLPAIVPRELTPSAEEEPTTWSPARVRPSVALQMKTLNNLVAGCKSRREATEFIRREYSEYPARLMTDRQPGGVGVETRGAASTLLTLNSHPFLDRVRNPSHNVITRLPTASAKLPLRRVTTTYDEDDDEDDDDDDRCDEAENAGTQHDVFVVQYYLKVSVKKVNGHVAIKNTASLLIERLNVSRINLSATGKACCDEKTNANADVKSSANEIGIKRNTAVRGETECEIWEKACAGIRTKVSQEQAAMRAGKKSGRGQPRRRPWKATRNNIAMNTRVSAITRNCDL
ncbi:hypothetical protein ALC57_09757 [Trachymyrmex cornetzi]|uniref:Uncharacterized protein n=1 Tax=Trachymyrmex cornetzi TaxID=471704 RepID=A0A195DY87_9HYME|nr:hypothetical protein ALC57_09757 [Trachymyrmex cornetzi]